MNNFAIAVIGAAQDGKSYAMLAATLALAGGAALASAQGVTNFSGRDPGVGDIIRALKPVPITPAPGVRTRAIKFPSQDGSAVTAARTPEPGTDDDAQAPKASFDQVQFQFDSAELTASARRMLDKIGQALTSAELRGLRFVVEGHTDAVGSDDYNLALSQRRAESVRRYLIVRLAVANDALVPVGKGETELLDPRVPGSAANRRVVIGLAP